jgi:hypothetical protein
MSNTVDLFERRIDKVANSPAAQRLRMEIFLVADQYRELYQRAGLHDVYITLHLNGEPPQRRDNVVRVDAWDHRSGTDGGAA